MVNNVVKDQKTGSPPEKVADIVLHALTTKNPKARYIVGKHSKALTLFPSILPIRFFDSIKFRLFGLPKKFGKWEKSET
jgi:hypothetical protein